MAFNESFEDFLFDADLGELDPDIDFLIACEEQRQHDKLILIASESICPRAVRMALASPFTNLYAEGYPHKRMSREERDLLLDYPHQIIHYRRYGDRRYYRGCDYVNFVEALAQKRVCELFATKEVPAHKIFANVQPLSGAAANNAVYQAFLREGDAVMGMALNCGGHLTHGSPANRSGRCYRIVPYEADPSTGRLNYDELYRTAEEQKVKMIIAGYSAYPWEVDWGRLREISDALPQRPIIMADIAHPAGLVVAGEFPNPVGHAHVITFTTHKTLCGPRGAVILTTDEELAKRIDAAVFPGEQGGPHVNNIAAKAVAFRIAQTAKFRRLQKRIVENAQHLARAVQAQGLKLAYGGTASHMLLIDLKSIPSRTGFSLRGEAAARILDLCGITCNKNTIIGDENAAYPSGIRLGTTWVTQRGMGKPHMEKIAELICRTLREIRAYDYIGRFGPLGRGKIELALMEEIRKEVRSLSQAAPDAASRRISLGYPHFHFSAESVQPAAPLAAEERDDPKQFSALEAARKSAVILDLVELSALEIVGARADLFLQDAGTADLAEMAQGQVRRTAFLGKDGRVIDDAFVLRLSADPHGRHRYLLLTNFQNTSRLRDWLRALSDGYVLFDDDDVFAKTRGPVVVDRPAENWRAIGLAGPKAGAVLEALSSSLPISPGSLAETLLAGIRSLVAQPRDLLDYLVLVRSCDAPALWAAILQAGEGLGAVAAGGNYFHRLRAQAGLPDYKDGPVHARDLLGGGGASLVKIEKTFFIGQKLLPRPPKPAFPRFEWREPESPLKRTMLFSEHVKLSARIAPFAGWEMPVWYRSIREEHAAVRKAAGLFDVGHMGILEVAGPYATEFLDILTTNHIRALNPGEGCYSYFLDVEGIPLDDVTIYCLSRDRYMLVVNAVNNNKVLAWLRAVNERGVLLDLEAPEKQVSSQVMIRDLRDAGSGEDRRVDLAIQGPRSLDILLSLIPDPKERALVRGLKRFTFTEARIGEIQCRIARTGYTGEEFGYELYVHPERVVSLWRLLLERGGADGLLPAGLGARDSLRTEAGLPLYGHELAGEMRISPIEAGYGAFVKFHKPFFVGRAAALRNLKERKREIIRFRLLSSGARAVRPGNPVVNRKGRVIGAVTSAALVEGEQIGMALVESRFANTGSRIGIFVLPRGEALHEKPKDRLEPGDQVLLHEEAEILPRMAAFATKKDLQFITAG